jgi:hypothetical protein
MGDDRHVHDLLRFGLLGLCVILYWPWTRDRSGMGWARPAKQKTKRRSKDRKPFPGLTHKPHCAACERPQASALQAPSCPPPRIVASHGRRREVDTQRHFCPHPRGDSHGWVGRGNSRANGHLGGERWRQLQCIVGHTYFLETRGTPWYGQRVPPERLVWVVGALAEGLGMRAVARVFEVAPNTVLPWLVEGADHAAAFCRHCLHDVRVT